MKKSIGMLLLAVFVLFLLSGDSYADTTKKKKKKQAQRKKIAAAVVVSQQKQQVVAKAPKDLSIQKCGKITNPAARKACESKPAPKAEATQYVHCVRSQLQDKKMCEGNKYLDPEKRKKCIEYEKKFCKDWYGS